MAREGVGAGVCSGIAPFSVMFVLLGCWRTKLVQSFAAKEQRFEERRHSNPHVFRLLTVEFHQQLVVLQFEGFFNETSLWFVVDSKNLKSDFGFSARWKRYLQGTGNRIIQCCKTCFIGNTYTTIVLLSVMIVTNYFL